jgi:hypothetical protein
MLKCAVQFAVSYSKLRGCAMIKNARGAGAWGRGGSLPEHRRDTRSPYESTQIPDSILHL